MDKKRDSEIKQQKVEIKMKSLINTVFLVSLLLANGVLAHAGLKSSVPKNNQQLTKLPKSLMLQFDKPVRLIKVELHDQNDTKISLNYKMTKILSEQFSIPLPKLKYGHFTVQWTALGEDMHKMSGHFSFDFKTNEKKNEKALTSKKLEVNSNHQK